MKEGGSQFDNTKIYSTKEITNFIKVETPFYPKNTGFLLVREGSIKVTYDFEDHIITPNEGVLISRNVIYEFHEIEESADLLLLVIDNDFQLRAPLQINRIDIAQKIRMYRCVHVLLTPEKFNHYWQLLSLLKEDDLLRNPVLDINFRHNIISAILYLLLDGIEKLASLQSSDESKSKRLALDYIKLVSTHFREHRHLSFYADKLSITSKHLSETVKKVTGKTAKEFINISLIDESRLLLSERKHSIAEIAYMLNFSDQFSFSKFLKRHTNMSPTEFMQYQNNKNT